MAGGIIFGEYGGEDWVYGCGFMELDGHQIGKHLEENDRNYYTG